MSVSVEIPTPLRRFTDGVAKLDCSAATLNDLLAELEGRFPGMARHLRDDSGQIRPFLNIYVNDEDIRYLQKEATAVSEGDNISIVPSIAGGAIGPLVLPGSQR